MSVRFCCVYVRASSNSELASLLCITSLRCKVRHNFGALLGCQRSTLRAGSLDPACSPLYSKMPSQGGCAMATTRAMLERRRSSRVLIRIPIQVFSNDFNGEPLDTPAEAIAVSRTGALLRTPFQPALGSRIEVLNGISQETQEFRVIRVSPCKFDGCFELGVELLYPTRNFWGIQFPDERLTA